MSRSPFISMLTAISLCGVLASCDQSPQGSGFRAVDLVGDQTCSLPTKEVRSSVARDAIPALSDPPLVAASEATYVSAEDRVLGLLLGDQALAVPLNLLSFHEVVNFDRFDAPIAVTYCPLTGSGIVFDRMDADNATFGVSGLLLFNNLIMFDRSNEESLWPQMDRSARCGPADGTQLSTLPVLEITWEGWTALHPETKVVSDQTGFTREYDTNPYGNYGLVGNTTLLYGMDVDPRLPMKERVLGLPAGGGGVAVPFSRLDDGEAVRVVRIDRLNNVVVFWHREHEAAMAYQVPEHLRPDGFTVRNGRIVDVATETIWTVDGRGEAGELGGTRLAPYRDAYVSFWFAWAAFQPQTTIWDGEGT